MPALENEHFARRRIENRVLNRSVTSRDTAQGANSERGVKRGRKTLGGDVAEIKPYGSIAESEIVEVVAPNFGDRPKLVRDDDVIFVKRLRREQGALDDPVFLEFLLAQFSIGK